MPIIKMKNAIYVTFDELEWKILRSSFIGWLQSLKYTFDWFDSVIYCEYFAGSLNYFNLCFL